MRYGIIRTSPRLPVPEDQRRLIETVGCDVILEQRSPAQAGPSIVMRLLHRLAKGDLVVVHSLEAFGAGVGDLARLLRTFNDSGVTLCMTGGGTIKTVEPMQPAPPALTLLADYEERYPTRMSTRRRAPVEAATLTTHQLKFARDMQRRGYALREIGLLFRLTPNEVAALIGPRA